MNKHTDRHQLRRLVFLVAILALLLLFPGETSHAALLPETSVSLTMSNPSCFQIIPANGACSIQIDNLNATGSSPSLSRVEVLINGNLRVSMSGFFESSAYLTSAMVRGGLTVACGRPNNGGLPNYGRAYTVTVNAYMSDDTMANDSANVYCPAFEGKTYIPFLRKK